MAPLTQAPFVPDTMCLRLSTQQEQATQRRKANTAPKRRSSGLLPWSDANPLQVRFQRPELAMKGRRLCSHPANRHPIAGHQPVGITQAVAIIYQVAARAEAVDAQAWMRCHRLAIDLAAQQAPVHAPLNRAPGGPRSRDHASLRKVNRLS